MIARISKFRRSMGDIPWALTDQALVSAVNFLTTILVARMVQIEEFGRFSIAWMIILLSKDLQNAFINSPMMSIGPKQREKYLPLYYGSALVQQLAFAAASFLFVFAGCEIASVIIPHLFVPGFSLALAAAVVADQMQDFIRRYFYANERPVAVLVNDIVNCCSRLIVLFLLFRYSPTDSVGTLWVMCGCALMAVAAGAFSVGSLKLDRDWIAATAQRHWGFSKWTTGNSILRWLSSNLIILMAGSVLGPQAIGAIRAAINVLAPRNVLILGLTNVVLVKGSRKYQTEGAPGLRHYLAKVTGLGLGFDVCVAILASSFADEIMFYLYGPDFVPYSFLIYWIACINIIHFFSFPVGMGLQIIEHTRPFFLSAIIEAAFGVLASYFLVKWFALPGTMSGLAVANVILLCCLAPPLIRRLRR
ncbi:MAG: lipopolysaccharide biosynthesis protein [Alphaproteobacteria bacterium]